MADKYLKIGIFTFLTSGQICVSIKRIYVHERIYDEFRDKLVAFAKLLKIGAGTDPDTFFGPIQNAMQYEKAKDLIGSIASENFTIALDGKVEGSEGYFIHPIIVDNPPETSRVVVEEPFAPIIPLMKWSEEDDAIARANGTGMGLAASVWSKDAEHARRIAEQIQAGIVWINTHFELRPHVPVAAQKGGGIGSMFGVDG